LQYKLTEPCLVISKKPFFCSWNDVFCKLQGYLPASLERRQSLLERKRLDYWNLVSQYYDTERDEAYQDTYRQIHIDIPRMSPLIPLFQQKTVQEMFERILFIWAIRHPASGYVQGINDLVTPFFMVFLQEVTAPGSLSISREFKLEC
jgi:TBC1 domain family member 2